ncbi:hypothetical protein PM082_023124 [Marasmius tenuissimus]|nr:hypothetical protein PM082_023124 [Marasmius tenuissimus]
MEFGINTPFARVLNTNYPPSTEELRSLRDLVQAPEEQIRQLDEEISRLQAKRQTLKQFVDLHHALLSPFRRLPADIWRLIFIQTLPDNVFGLCTRTTKSSPLLLTTICHSWREIALSTPSLWNSIHIHFPIVQSSETLNPDCITRLHERKECLKAWLDRSGSLPITVSLAAQTYPLDGLSRGRPSAQMPESSPILTTELTELLIQYLPRWRTAVFNSGIYLLDLTPLESLPASSLSSLESFCSFGALHNRYGQQTNAHVDNDLFASSPLENLLTKARSLRRLELFYDNISAETLSLPIPWHHLNELSIIFPVLSNRHSSLDPAQLMQGLAAKCRSLTTLTIILSDSNLRADATAAISHPIQWPSLQNFRISFLDNAIQYATLFASVNTSNDLEFRPAVIQIFDSITLPSLRRLFVGFYGDDEESDSRLNHAAHLPFEDLLQRSQCLLTHFEIFHPRIVAGEAVIRVLQQLETLVSLNLGYGRLTGTKRRQSFGLEYFMEPPEPSWADRNVSSTWRKHWLDQILREFLQAGTDADRVESPADALAALPICPRLEELNIGGCALDDRNILLDFATKTRRESLGTFRVDLGRPLRGDVWKIFESLQMQRPTQDSETTRVAQEIGGVMLDWRWDETSEDTVSMFDTAATGLPQEGSWWNESLWL